MSNIFFAHFIPPSYSKYTLDFSISLYQLIYYNPLLPQDFLYKMLYIFLLAFLLMLFELSNYYFLFSYHYMLNHFFLFSSYFPTIPLHSSDLLLALKPWTSSSLIP